MAIFLRKNIFKLMVSDLILHTNVVQFKEHMQKKHGWSEEDFKEYMRIFFKELNNLSEDSLNNLPKEVIKT